MVKKFGSIPCFVCAILFLMHLDSKSVLLIYDTLFKAFLKSFASKWTQRVFKVFRRAINPLKMHLTNVAKFLYLLLSIVIDGAGLVLKSAARSAPC